MTDHHKIGGAHIPLLVVFISLLLPSTACADETLTDRERERKVYALYADYRKELGNVPDISAEAALLRMASEKPVFVDGRHPREQEISMLPGAVTTEEFLENQASYEGRMIIVYCTIGYRSGKLVRKLMKKGIRVFNLQGGILAWLHNGGKVYKDNRPVMRVHVYGKKWDLAPLSYEAVR